MSSRTLLYVVSGLTAAAIVAGALVYGFVVRPKFDQSAAAPTPTAAPQASSSPAAASTPSAMASAAPSAPKPSSAAAPAAISTPAFDVVRIEPSGDAVVAGRAAPNAAIVLSDGDKPIGEAAADFAGEFVILPPTLSPGSHSLRLSAKVGAAAPLLSDVYVAEVAGAGVAAKPATPTPTALAATTPAPMVAAAKPMAPASSAASASPTALASPAALPSPAALASKPSAVPTPPAASVVVAPSPAASAAGEIVVGSVRAVDPAGLEAEGSAPPGAKVQLRLNDTLLAEAVAGPDGKWSLTIQRGLTPGDYVLEAEIVDSAGARVAHVDAPFIYPRREVAAVAAATPQASPSPAAAPSPSQVAALPASSPSQTAAPLASTPQASPAAVASAPVAPASAAPAPEPTPTASLAAPAPVAEPSSPVAAATPAAAPAAALAATPAPPTAVAEPTTPPPAAETPVATTAHPVVAEVRTVTVAKGDNLWDLARHFYGDGLRYADLYTANSAQIHDPNLIFVGQIFVVPQAAVAK